MPLEMAGVAMQTSSIEFVASTSSVGPDRITYTSPSSLVTESLPSPATGDALNIAPTNVIRTGRPIGRGAANHRRLLP